MIASITADFVLKFSIQLNGLSEDPESVTFLNLEIKEKKTFIMRQSMTMNNYYRKDIQGVVCN